MIEKTFHTFDGVELAYFEAGRGDTVVLLHGFAADTHHNWIEPGVWSAILDSGRRVVGLDARGHGNSEKPHDPRAYSHEAMVRDVECLLEELGNPTVDVCGYSMGGITTLRLAVRHDELRSAILGGIGPGVLGGGNPARAAEIADALEATDVSAITGSLGRGFRAFADVTGADRAALVAIQRSRTVESPLDIESLLVRSLVLAGSRDELVGDPATLAERLGAQLRLVPGNHLSAVFAPAFSESIVEFLERRVDQR